MIEKKAARANEILKEEIGNIVLREVGLAGVLITVTEVRISAPRTEASVYVSVYPDDKFDEIFKIFDKEIYNIQQQINHRLRMRPIPKIIFKRDYREAEAGKVEKILEEIREKSDNE